MNAIKSLMNYRYLMQSVLCPAPVFLPGSGVTLVVLWIRLMYVPRARGMRMFTDLRPHAADAAFGFGFSSCVSNGLKNNCFHRTILSLFVSAMASFFDIFRIQGWIPVGEIPRSME
jgi:hypothetical protein